MNSLCRNRPARYRIPRGLVYALTELVDRVGRAGDDLFGDGFPLAGRPATRIRSITRLFCNEREDKAWFHDKSHWIDYLTMLATNRFNRFSLTLGIQYDYPYHNHLISDVYPYQPSWLGDHGLFGTYFAFEPEKAYSRLARAQYGPHQYGRADRHRCALACGRKSGQRQRCRSGPRDGHHLATRRDAQRLPRHLGIGEEYVAVPWEQVRSTPGLDTLVIEVSPEQPMRPLHTMARRAAGHVLGRSCLLAGPSATSVPKKFFPHRPD